MKALLTFCAGILFNSFAFGQDSTVVLDWTEYFKKLKTADSLYSAKQYPLAAQAYAAAFAFNDQRFSSGDRYQAARAWAMLGNKDSAFANLKKEVENGYYNYKQFAAEKAFEPLKTDATWKYLSRRIKDNQKREDEKLGKYKSVKPKLEKILTQDQKYRQNYMEVWKKYGDGSKELSALKKKMRKIDRSNLKYVTKILDQHGWIGYDTIGLDANNALFLVIQHADLATQEKYLPLLRSAVRQKKAIPEALALLEDRVLTRRGEKQIYGTQVQCDNSGFKCWVLPIEDEKNVDLRRKSVGLKPLAVYLMQYGIDYKIPE